MVTGRANIARIGRCTTAAMSQWRGLALMSAHSRAYHSEKDFNILDGSVEMSQEEWNQNGKSMQELVDKLKKDIHIIKQGGGPVACERHSSKNKMLPRQRVDRLLDPGYVELAFGLGTVEIDYSPQVCVFGIISVGRLWHVRG